MTSGLKNLWQNHKLLCPRDPPSSCPKYLRRRHPPLPLSPTVAIYSLCSALPRS